MVNVGTSMKLSILLGLALSLLLWVAAPAQAQTAEDQTVEQQIAVLRQQTVDATTFTNPKDQAGLIDKLDSATRKLSEGKTADALTNLTSFRNKVSDLLAQGKLGETEAEALIAGADAAIADLQPPA